MRINTNLKMLYSQIVTAALKEKYMYLERGRIVQYRRPRNRVEFRTSARNHLIEIGLTEDDIRSFYAEPLCVWLNFEDNPAGVGAKHLYMGFVGGSQNKQLEVIVVEEDMDHDIIIHVDKMTPQYEEVFYQYLKEIYDEQ